MAEASFKATAPDGTPIEFTAPANASEDELQRRAYEAYLKKQGQQEQRPPAQETGIQELRDNVRRMRERLADTKPGTATYKRMVSDINEAEKELERLTGTKPQPPTEPPNVLMEAAKEKVEETGLPLVGAGAGLATGLLESKGLGPASILERGAAGARAAAATPGAARQPAGALSAATAAPQAPTAGPARPPIPMGPADAGRMAPGQTGVMPYNYAKAAGLTDIEAGRALDMTKQPGGVHDLATQRREALQRIGPGFRENPMFGGLMTPESVGGGPRVSYVQRPPEPTAQTPQPPTALQPVARPQPVPFTPKPPSPLDQATALLKQMAQTGLRGMQAVGGVARALPVLSYPLAGYQIGSDISEMREADTVGRGLAGTSALGTALSLHPVTAPVGLPMALGSSGIRYVRGRLKPDEQISPEEEAAARRPAFGLYPSMR